MTAKNYFVINRLETGDRIYKHRKAMHLSREGLANILSVQEDVDISINSIGKWERGEVDISYDYARALSKIFGCKLYGELVVFHLRGLDDERDQPVLFFQVNIFFKTNVCKIVYIRLLFCQSLVDGVIGKRFYNK